MGKIHQKAIYQNDLSTIIRKYSPKVWKCETALAEIGDMV